MDPIFAIHPFPGGNFSSFKKDNFATKKTVVSNSNFFLPKMGVFLNKYCPKNATYYPINDMI